MLGLGAGFVEREIVFENRAHGLTRISVLTQNDTKQHILKIFLLRLFRFLWPILLPREPSLELVLRDSLIEVSILAR